MHTLRSAARSLGTAGYRSQALPRAGAVSRAPILLLVVVSGLISYNTLRPKTRLEPKLKSTRSQEEEAQPAPTSYLTYKEVEAHNLAHDAWVVIDGSVYDVTNFHKHHPGGANLIVSNAGKDVTELFMPLHPPDALANNLGPEQFKGRIDPSETAKYLKAYKDEVAKTEAARVALPPVETMLGLDELQAAAEMVLSPRAANYYASASLDEISLQDNRSCFRKCRLIPRVMRDVSTVSVRTTIFGVDTPLPIYISPSSNALLGHPEGELNITRGAAATGIVQGVSAAASYSLKEILDEKYALDEDLDNPMGMAYQVYVQVDRSRTVDQVKQAVAGGVQALILTVDSAVGDLRQKTEKMRGTKGDAQPGIRMEPFEGGSSYHDPGLNWEDLKWLRELAKGVPIYLKGVSNIEDVRLARDHNLAGCILSNHGGRQCDQARTGFDSLRAIHAEDPELLKQVEVYIDGGIRRGTDVLQAIAFGARGVGLGRTFLWAQTAYGEEGVIRAIRILESEIVTAMRLLGLTSLSQVDHRMVECLQEVWK